MLLPAEPLHLLQLKAEVPGIRGRVSLSSTRMINEPQLNQALKRIQQSDPRYARNAYLYAFHGLDFTMRRHLRLKDGERRHVGARDLLTGMKECASEDFGFLARQVWESWGIRGTSDWGNIIFNLINARLMNAADDDDIEQFRNVYSLDEAFPTPEQGLMIKPRPEDGIEGGVNEMKLEDKNPAHQNGEDTASDEA